MLPQDWNHGGGALWGGGQRPSLRDILNPMTGLTLAEVKALGLAESFDGGRLATPEGRRWKYSLASALVSDGDQLVIVPTSNVGRFLAEPGQTVDLALPIGFATADAAALWTVPVGCYFRLLAAYWEVTASFTGGTTPAIGLSSNKATATDLTTKGDILGGGSGDLTATLVSTVPRIPGTLGTDMDTLAKIHTHILVPGNTIRYDRIANAFTAGAGFAHIVGVVLANPGV